MKNKSHMLRAVVFGVMFLSATQIANSAAVVSKSFSYFKIGGKTAEDLDRELSATGL